MEEPVASRQQNLHGLILQQQQQQQQQQEEEEEEQSLSMEGTLLGALQRQEASIGRARLILHTGWPCVCSYESAPRDWSRRVPLRALANLCWGTGAGEGL